MFEVRNIHIFFYWPGPIGCLQSVCYANVGIVQLSFHPFPFPVTVGDIMYQPQGMGSFSIVLCPASHLFFPLVANRCHPPLGGWGNLPLVAFNQRLAKPIIFFLDQKYQNFFPALKLFSSGEVTFLLLLLLWRRVGQPLFQRRGGTAPKLAKPKALRILVTHHREKGKNSRETLLVWRCR